MAAPPEQFAPRVLSSPDFLPARVRGWLGGGAESLAGGKGGISSQFERHAPRSRLALLEAYGAVLSFGVQDAPPHCLPLPLCEKLLEAKTIHSGNYYSFLLYIWPYLKPGWIYAHRVLCKIWLCSVGNIWA